MTDQCPKCQGRGYVADTADQEPWSEWENIGTPAPILFGLVKPLVCPECGDLSERGKQ